MENLLLFFVISFVSFLLGYVIGSIINKQKIVELSDVFTPASYRSEKKVLQDAVMQLQNEIVESGAVKIESTSASFGSAQEPVSDRDGKVRVSIKVVV